MYRRGLKLHTFVALKSKIQVVFVFVLFVLGCLIDMWLDLSSVASFAVLASGALGGYAIGSLIASSRYFVVCRNCSGEVSTPGGRLCSACRSAARSTESTAPASQG